MFMLFFKNAKAAPHAITWWSHRTKESSPGDSYMWCVTHNKKRGPQRDLSVAQYLLRDMVPQKHLIPRTINLNIVRLNYSHHKQYSRGD